MFYRVSYVYISSMCSYVWRSNEQLRGPTFGVEQIIELKVVSWPWRPVSVCRRLVHKRVLTPLTSDRTVTDTWMWMVHTSKEHLITGTVKGFYDRANRLPWQPHHRYMITTTRQSKHLNRPTQLVCVCVRLLFLIFAVGSGVGERTRGDLVAFFTLYQSSTVTILKQMQTLHS